MKSQVLHTAWCHISGEAAGEIWTWSLLGVKGKQRKLDVVIIRGRKGDVRGRPCLRPKNVKLYTLFKTEDPENSTQSGGTSLRKYKLVTPPPPLPQIVRSLLRICACLKVAKWARPSSCFRFQLLNLSVIGGPRVLPSCSRSFYVCISNHFNL